MSSDDIKSGSEREDAGKMRGEGVYFRTFGCQMNVHDTERMEGILALEGVRTVDSPDDADIIIINTCSVRGKPEEKTYSEIGRYHQLKQRKGDLVIAVTGCVAQQRGDEIIRRFPYVDLVIGTQNVGSISELIAETRLIGRPVVKTDFYDKPTTAVFPRRPNIFTAFVTITQGCDNFCSYCIVPYVRGREMSRPMDDIMGEVRSLVDAGVKEVTLLGQNVNSYRDPDLNLGFPELIRRVADIEGIYRLRFVTSHPKDLSRELISCFRDIEMLSSHIHLPVQSGSDTILKAMNRGYTIAQYKEKVAELRSVREDLAVTTDIIVGFPGEDEADFNETVSMMEEIAFDNSFSFKYSIRPGTAAANLNDNVSPVEKSERLEIVQSLQRSLTMRSNLKNVNSVHNVLATGPSIRDPREITGRSDQNKVVNFSGGEDTIGSVVPVKIKKANSNSLWGEAVSL